MGTAGLSRHVRHIEERTRNRSAMSVFRLSLAERRNHLATIAATATAVPPHVLTREDVKTYMRHVFDVGERRLDAMMTVIDNAQVHKRHSIFPIEYIVEPRSLAQTSRDYQEHAVRLGQRAAEAC